MPEGPITILSNARRVATRVRDAFIAVENFYAYMVDVTPAGLRARGMDPADVQTLARCMTELHDLAGKYIGGLGGDQALGLNPIDLPHDYRASVNRMVGPAV